MHYCRHILYIIVILCLPLVLQAQEEEAIVSQTETYLNNRSQSLEKYLHRSQKIQQRLLKRLQRKEAKYARHLKETDSAAYAQYTAMPLGYDSIAVIAQDSAALARSPKKKSTLIDSLRKIQGFAQQQSNKLDFAGGLAQQNGLQAYGPKLDQLQQQLNAQEQIKNLISQRATSLESLAGNNNISGLKGIQQQVYYAGEKVKALKELAAEPDEAEAQALEFLQGSQGFSEYFNKSNNKAFGGLGSNATAADLERLGYQTKRQTAEALQQTFGDKLPNLQQGMTQQVQAFQEKINGIGGGKLNEVKEAANTARENIATGKQNLEQAKALPQQAKNIEKPSFKKNPERGKPFLQRLETQYNFQTTRATPEGRPAMLELAAAVGFKHTPKLSYGIGISGSIGLGQGWEQVRISYEGIGARLYVDWQLQYGISIQAGYEKILRPANRDYLSTETNNTQQINNPNTQNNLFKEAFGAAQDAAYIGLMKRYRINSKWNGTFLLGYNFLWQQSGTRTPLMVRIGWSKM